MGRATRTEKQFRKQVVLNGTLTVTCPFDGTNFHEEDDAISVNLENGFEVFSDNPTGFVAFHIRKP